MFDVLTHLKNMPIKRGQENTDLPVKGLNVCTEIPVQ